MTTYHDQWIALGKDPDMGMSRELDAQDTKWRETIRLKGCTCDAPAQRRLTEWARWETDFMHRDTCQWFLSQTEIDRNKGE